jgi:hypothetical protein
MTYQSAICPFVCFKVKTLQKQKLVLAGSSGQVPATHRKVAGGIKPDCKCAIIQEGV